MLLSIIVVLIVAVSAIFLIYYSNTKNYLKSGKNKIYPGVVVDSIDLSGKTKEEAKDLLNEECTEKLLNKELKIIVEDKTFQYKYSDISAGYDVDKCIEEAINYGKDLSIFKQRKLIKNKDNNKQELKLNFTYDEEKFAELEENIKSQVDIEPENAILHFNYGDFYVTKEVVGYELNTDGINEKMKQAISGDLNKESIINLEMVENNLK